MLTFAIVAVVVIALLVLLFRSARRSYDKDKRSAQQRDWRDATVIYVAQVSAGHESGQPKLKLTLRFLEAGGAERIAELTTNVDYANIPRSGDAVIVSVDRLDVSKMKYGGLKANLPSPTVYPIDYFDLQRRGIRTGQVISAKELGPKRETSDSTGTVGPLHLQVRLDSVTEARRIVEFRQETLDYLPTVLENIYVFVQPARDPIRGDQEQIIATPLRLTGGVRRTGAEHRLDRLVLGPSIRSAGKQAQGTVLEVQEVWVGAAYARDSGARKFHLRFRVTPNDGGPPYEAEQDMTLTDEQRVQQICRVGASVPLRCDWNDAATVATDGGALGLPDPYPSVIERWNKAVRNGTAGEF